ncbi:fumarylacetoacetase [Roseicyclus mahoneyensis]|uniref:fumarylacetoacetase n=1 Tax=Roseicyclus mahoneyensis TaxID=164332 RepID=A0A316GQL6_9RHOB|nr:fumarylacetoacetase [Roseicyclus mahoneyensis]PWK62322.1 fumarylacetoacetate hydrolase [Roseicyclus mahoneyensis]
MSLNATHDPGRRSWIDSANAPGCDYPIQNLPWGVFSDSDGTRRVGVAIGDLILDVTALEAAGIVEPAPGRRVFGEGFLNPFMALGPAVWSATRAALADLLDARTGDRALPLVAQKGATMHLPIFARSYTDFYASREHATNVGTMFRGADNALPPNWLHMPIGYNGRASTVVVSGTGIRRPLGQLKAADDPVPRLGPSQKLDFELELGAILGTGNAMGAPVTTVQAWEMIFGFVLLNDWSARDVQVWEYQPLGPFQSKAFGTTISPWVVTREALAPFVVAPPERALPLLPYLHETAPHNLDLALEIDLAPQGQGPTTIARTNARHLYYSAAQQIAHHAISGCAMETGDLIGSGTISGPTPDSRGALLELTWNGRDPVTVAGGTRSFLQDGDSVTLRGWCEGAYRLGFGPCEGTILPAPEAP